MDKCDGVVDKLHICGGDPVQVDVGYKTAGERTKFRPQLDTCLHFDLCATNDFAYDFNVGNVDSRILERTESISGLVKADK